MFAAIGTGGFSRIDAQASLSLCKGAVWHARETGTGIHFAPSHLRPEWPPDTLHKLHQRWLRLEIGDGGGSQMQAHADAVIVVAHGKRILGTVA